MLDEPNRETTVAERDQVLLDLIRAGKVDAEIAVRLGVSTAEVKERIERLMRREGAKDREALRQGLPPPPFESPVPEHEARRARAQVPVWVVATIAVLAASAGAAAVWVARDDSAQPTAAEVAVAPTSFQAAPPPTPTVYATTIAGRQMERLGKPFATRGNFFANTKPEARETLLTAEFEQSVVFRYDGFEDTLVDYGGGPTSAFFSLRRAEATLLLAVTAQPGTELIYGDDDSIAFFARGEGGPKIWMYARAPEGETYYHLEMGIDGYLYISAEAVPAGAAVTFDSGELLDVSEMVRVGTVGRENHWTYCATETWADYAGHPCTALIRGADFTPYAPGNLTCLEGDRVQLRFEGFFGVLQLRAENSLPRPCGPTPAGIGPSQPLGYPGLWSAVAFAPDGSPLSVVVTHDGTVYVGEVTPKFGCPCRTGS